MKITSIILAGALPMIMLPLSVQGHGYMYSPRSRNFYAHLDGVDGDAVAGIPPKEYCHHCLNTNNGVCGKSAYHDYDVWNDSLDNPMPWISQATFTAGDTIRVKSHLTAYHYGHMELRGCPLGRDSTWDCFEKPEHTLRFVRDISFDMPADSAYPERGYYYGSTDFEMEYEIPETLYGATVLLQWRYITANSCSPPGYDAYFAGANSQGIALPDSFWSPLLSECQLPYPEDGSRSNVWPEQFFNCAEVMILNPDPNATKDPTPAPVLATSTSSPVANDAIAETNCGWGVVGNGICSDPSLCCSDWGYCGTGSAYCGSNTSDEEDEPTTPCNDDTISGLCTSERRCGYGWVDANTKCGAPCTMWEDPACDVGENCYGNLSNDLPCCHEEDEEGPSSPTASPSLRGTSSPVSQDNPSNDDDSGDDDHSNVVGTCGYGSVGNGICADTSLCCSQWGWCGNSAAHCAEEDPAIITSTPTMSPTNLLTLPTNTDDDESSEDNPPPQADEHSRLVAYLGNWQSCPTPEQYDQYTHIVIAFAVSYTWNPGKNSCSASCDIATPPVCNDAPNPGLIQEWKNAGKKVLLSFGGAGMGGSWAGDANDCWEYCFGKEDHVVDQLVGIVSDMDLDGVDLDYEYFYEDDQNNSGFSKGLEAQQFLSLVTTGLRQKLPTDSILAHAPMDSDLVPGSAYYDILKNHAHEIDFLMPQYYNGITRPGSDFGVALDHYTVLVEDIFGGDPTKVVFGFCISDCSGTGSNLDGFQSALVMDQLQSTYSCNGGAFFWVVEHDIAGTWSTTVSEAIAQNSCF